MSLRIYTAYLNNIIKCVEGYKPKLLHELSHLSDIVTTVKELDDLFYMEELLVHAEGEFELISSYLFLYEPLPISTRERLEKSGKPKEIVNAIIENLGELINDDFDVDIDEVFDSDGIFDSPTNIVQEFESQHIESYLDATSNDGVFDEVSIYDGSDDEEELEDEEDEYPMDMDDEYPMDIDDFGEDDLEDDDSEDGVVFEDEYPMEDEDFEDFEDFEDEYPMEDDEEDLLDEEGYGDTYLDEDDYPMDDEDDDDYPDEEDDYPMDDEEDDDYPMDDDEEGIEDSWDEPDDEYDMDLEDEDKYDDEYGMEDEYDDEYEDDYDMEDDDEYEDDYDMEPEDDDEYDMDSDDEDEYDMESDDEDEYDMESEDDDEYDMDSEDDDEYNMDFDDEIEDDDFENDVEGFVSTPKKNNIDFTNNFGENLKPLGKGDSSFHQDLSSSRAIGNSFSLGGTPVQPSEKTIDDRIADNIVKLYDYLVQGYRKAKEVIIVDEEE